jgi:prepilin-type processing-associated H-X9-DG protein
MNAPVTPGEEILFICEGPTQRRWLRGRGRIVRRVGAAGVALLAALLIAQGVADAVRESRRGQCSVQLKQLWQALQDYHEAHGHFPAPALVRGDGTPLLSWRVAILPYLGHRALYDRFNRDEPWDSPHNRALVTEMPSVFACPGGPERREGRTGYRVVVGPKSEPTSVNTPFEPTRGVDRREITDGEANTGLIFETDATVPWTRPDDLQWTRGGPLPRLAGPHPGGVHVLFVDGLVRFLKGTIDPQVLWAILTINGGEVVGGG